jgi:pheromone shutdown protein TraB
VRRLRDALGEVLLAPQGTYGSGAAPPAALVEATSGNPSEFTKETVSSAMAVLKQRDNVRALSQYLKSELPPLYTALIAERDAYMARSLLESDGQKLVAVVGLAHVDGIEAAILREAGARDARPRMCV